MANMPGVRPATPHFSSGPCAKRPGWSLQTLTDAVLGRSHRSKLGKAKLKRAIDLTREVLEVPVDYRIGRLSRLITGWVAYFRLAQRVSVLGKLDGWLRRRLRQIRWKEWKTTAAKRHNLRIRGISESEARKWAGVSRRYWKVAGSQILQVSLPNSYWDHLGLKTLSQTWQRFNQTA